MNVIFHIYNRGVDKRDVFCEKAEYSYFIHLLYVLNDKKTANNTKRNLERVMGKGPTSTHQKGSYERNKLVDILAFVLMPNHYHLLVKEVSERGIQRFMHKLGTGYTMFFNKKHERTGSLFQGNYKRVHIKSNSQLLYIPHYIHLNPLSLTRVKGKNEKLKYLEEYKWSSLPDYIGVKNFPSITSREFVTSLFRGQDNYKKDIFTFISKGASFHDCPQQELIDLNG